MNIRKELDDQWQQLQAHPAGAGTLTIPTEAGTLECVLAQSNEIAGELESLRYHSKALRRASAEELEQVGQGLCRRVTYLLEPLTLIEIDREATSVQLRSAEPEQLDEEVRYFELSVDAASGMQFNRYRAPRGEGRSIIPAPLTKEVVTRLANDLVAAGK